MPIFKKTRVFLLLLSVLSLVACLDVEQDIWINQNGGARLHYKIGLSEHFLLTQALEANAQTCAQFYTAKDALVVHEEVSAVEGRSYFEAGVFYCERDIMLHDYADIEPAQDWILRDSQIESSKSAFLTEFTLRKQQDGRGVFRQHVRNKSGDSDKPLFESQAEQLTNRIMGQILAGRYWTTTLHTFKIEEANGTLNDDQTSVSWKVPLYDLLLNKEFAMDMQAKFVAQPPWYSRWYKQFRNWISEKNDE